MADITVPQETVSRYLTPPQIRADAIPPGQALRLLAMHTGNTLVARFIAHGVLLSICSLFLLSGVALGFLIDRTLPFAKGIDFALALACCLMIAGFGILVYRMGMTNWSDCSGALGRIAKNMVLSPRWTNAIPALLSLVVLVAVMNAIVASLPDLGAHSGAANLIALDRAFHLGVLPHQITHAFAGGSGLTVLLDQLYQISLLWVLAFYVAIACAKYDTPNRQQFLISLSLAWVAGALLMVLVSSAGPAFSIQMIPGNSPYADLFTRLAAIDAETKLWSLGLQQAHIQAVNSAGAGAHFAAVAAMPSLVTASLTIVTLTALNVRTSLGVLASALLLLSTIAAVHLGWNYAIDCYAGAILGFVSWKAVGWVMLRTA